MKLRGTKTNLTASFSETEGMVDSARGADTTITEERQETATPRDKESWQYIEDDGKKIIEHILS